MSGSVSKWVVAVLLTTLTWIGVGLALDALYDFAMYTINVTPRHALGLAYGYLIYYSFMAGGIVVVAGLLTREAWREE